MRFVPVVGWLATGLCLSGAPMARSAKLPEWAVEIADRARPVEAEATEDDWRILLSETRVEVRTDGTFSVRRRLAAQALRGRVPSIGLGAYRFDDDARILTARGWHVPPSGKTVRSRGPTVDVTVDTSFVTDEKARFVPLDGAELGSLAFFEFEARETPVTLSLAHLFYEGAPLDLARLLVATAPGWSVRHDWLRIDGPEPETDGGVRRWELRDLPGHAAAEPLGETAAERAPLLVLAFSPPGAAGWAGPAVVADWTAFSGWYEALVRGRHAVAPEIRRVLDAEPGADVYDEIRGAGRYVRDNVRYVAKEIGIGSQQPRPAGQVLGQKYGDCKDKGTLFRSLLAVDGLESYPILVNASRERTVSSEVPAMTSFNHFVVGVPLPPEAAIPSDFAAATIDVGGMGPLLVVDTTDERTAIGSLPGYLAGKRALLVAGPRSRLIDIPGDDARAHRIERSFSMDLTDRNAPRMVASVALFGEPAARARSVWKRSMLDRRRAIEADVDRAWPGARIDEVHVEAENDAGAYEERVAWHAEVAGGDRILPLFPAALDDLPRLALDRRKTDVVYPYPMTIRRETRVIAAGELPLPDAQHSQGDGWSVETTYELRGEVLQANFSLELTRRRFEPADFEELRRFWDATRRAASVNLPASLTHPSPSPARTIPRDAGRATRRCAVTSTVSASRSPRPGAER